MLVRFQCRISDIHYHNQSFKIAMRRLCDIFVQPNKYVSSAGRMDNCCCPAAVLRVCNGSALTIAGMVAPLMAANTVNPGIDGACNRSWKCDCLPCKRCWLLDGQRILRPDFEGNVSNVDFADNSPFSNRTRLCFIIRDVSLYLNTCNGSGLF